MEQTFEARFLSARRAVIAARFQNLNEMQREGVLTTQGPLLLLAGAGSGKTTVLINRIANLIAFGEGSDSNEIPEYIAEADVTYLEDYLKTRDPAMQQQAERLCALRPAAPWSILAITFTNKAANELKARLQALLGDYAMDVWAMTFHAACCRILRREIGRLDGYTGRFTIYDTSDSERVMKDILKDFGLDEKSLPPRLALSVISKAKDKRQGPEQFSKHAGKSGDYRMDRIAQLYAEYEKRLHEANALDFDDIILKTVELLEQFEDVRTYYQRKFHYVMIDEYQDTNQLQYQLTALLAGGYENICVVGDDDQSIYKFRGATIENILSFEKQFKGARVIRLEQNYRSTQAILNAANAVISHNRGRKGKKLWTQNAAGDRITVYEAASESDEANYISSRIISMSKGKNFKDFAVLYRTNAQSNAVENAFKRSGIPYRIIGGTRFFDRAEVKDMRTRQAMLELKEALHLPVLPRRIEGYDISNTQGILSVASMVVFQDGLPDKKAYRIYRIKTVEGANDFASMAEVITRRFTHGLKERHEREQAGLDPDAGSFSKLPDVILIDGGPEQLLFAHRAMQEAGASVPMFGLAKRFEEIYLPGREDPIVLDRRSNALHLVQYVRDEAHRFGITHHRALRGKEGLRSELSAIPGVGPKKQAALIRHFRSVKAIFEATQEELCQVEGISTGLAQRIYDYAAQRGKPSSRPQE